MNDNEDNTTKDQSKFEEKPISEINSPLFSLFAKYDDDKIVFEYKDKISGDKKHIKKYIHSNGNIYIPDINGKSLTLDKEEEIRKYQNRMIDKEFEIAQNGKNAIPNTFKGLKAKIDNLIYQSQIEWDEITEIIKDYLITNETIYSIRRDKEVEMWIYKEGIYIPEAKSYIKEFAQNILKKKLSPQISNKILFKIEVSSYINQEDFFENKHINLQPVQNGILNIETRELNEFNPEYIFFNKLPVTYDPSIKYDEVEVFFKEILEDKHVRNLQKLTGYCLLKDYPIHKGFMLHGKGRNGKGQFLYLLSLFLNTKNTCDLTLKQMEEDNFTLVRLHNKMANISGDINSSYIENTGIFKKLTGGDMMQVRRKFLTDLQMKNHAKMIFACNEMPDFKDDSEGFWDRWVLIDFNKHFVTKEIYDKLKDEEKPKHGILIKDRIKELLTKKNMSALLNWSLEGLDELMKTDYFEGQEDLKKKWKMKSNNLLLFVDQMCVVDYGQQMNVSDFKMEYGRFCNQNGLTSINNKIIETTLTKEFGVFKHKTNQGWVFKSINLKSKSDKSDKSDMVLHP